MLDSLFLLKSKSATITAEDGGQEGERLYMLRFFYFTS